MTTRPNGMPALRQMPITFTRRAATEAATEAFTKLVGKSTDRATHSPNEYVSADGRWVIRSVQHSGHGSTNSGRTRWHVALDGHYFGVSYDNRAAHSLEDAIDEIHRRIGRGFRDGFKVLAQMRSDAEAREQAAVRRAENLARAKDLLGRAYAADPSKLVEQLAAHVNLDALARAIEAAEAVQL